MCPPNPGSQVSVIPTPQADVALEDSLDLPNSRSVATSGYLTCDSQANSDYDDTDGEAGAYTDGEAEDAYDQPGLARSSEPAQMSPSPSPSEQMGPPTLVRGAGGAEWGLAQCLARGSNAYPLWHRQGVTSSCPGASGAPVPMGEHSPAPGWGTNPAPSSDPPISGLSQATEQEQEQQQQQQGQGGQRYDSIRYPARQGQLAGGKAASPGAGEGPAEPWVPALPGPALPRTVSATQPKRFLVPQGI